MTAIINTVSIVAFLFAGVLSYCGEGRAAMGSLFCAAGWQLVRVARARTAAQ